MFCIKSYNYSKLILCYGPDKGAMVSVTWNNNDKIFKLAFGATNNSLNAHSLIQEQLESHLNEHRNLAQIVQLLHETYEPLLSISKLPTIPQLGIHNTVSIFYSMLKPQFWSNLCTSNKISFDLSFSCHSSLSL